MSTINQCIENNKKLITAIDQLLTTGNWEDSLFLRANKKRFLALREKIIALNGQADSLLSQSVANKTIAWGEHKRLIYILLHQTHGNQLSHWEQLLKGLIGQSAGRPIYSSEEHIKAVVRSKPYPSKEGYVVLVVDKQAILQPYSGHQVTDRFGYELLMLKENAVRFDSMVEFVNEDKRYRFHNGHLQLINSSLNNGFFEGEK